MMLPMGALTEVEIFDCLKTNLRLAAQSCDKLAVSPRKGPTYVKLREELRLVEGACRQAAFWRGGDARWLQVGILMAEAHKRAGDWLRGIKQPDGTRVKLANGILHPAFEMLAESLRALIRLADNTKNKATGRLGMILPAPLRGPHRDTRPVSFAGMRQHTNGLLVPDTLPTIPSPPLVPA